MERNEYANDEPSITREANDALFARLKAGEDVRAEIIERNFGLADSEAKRWYRPSGPDFDELRAAARAGLIPAVDGFDPSRGLSFGTYACHWIRRELGDCVKRSKLLPPPRGVSKGSKIPRHARMAAEPVTFIHTNYLSIVNGPNADAFDELPDEKEADPITPDNASALLDVLRPRFSPFELMLIDARFGIGSESGRARGTYRLAKRLGIDPKAVNTIVADAIARVKSELDGASPEDVINGL